MTPIENALDNIRRSIRISRSPEGKPQITFNVVVKERRVAMGSPTWSYSSTTIDAVLYELLSAVTYLMMSPDVARLETVLRAEFNSGR